MGRKNRNARLRIYHEYAGMDLALPIEYLDPKPDPRPARKDGMVFFAVYWIATVIIAGNCLLAFAGRLIG